MFLLNETDLVNPTLALNSDPNLLIHPIFDHPEKKLDPSELGLMKMTRTVRISLYLLRIYLLAMVLLVTYRMLELAGVVK